MQIETDRVKDRNRFTSWIKRERERCRDRQRERTGTDRKRFTPGIKAKRLREPNNIK